MALGTYLRERLEPFDHVVAGNLPRHIETLDEMGWRAQEVDPRWNEYDAHGLLDHLAPQLLEEDPKFCKLWQEWLAGKAAPEKNRYFQRMFEYLMREWANGGNAAGVETFAAFHSRVSTAFSHLLNGPVRGRNILAVTSGGPIGVTVQIALRLDPITALEINWNIRNASITRCRFTPGRISLDCFNTTPHLSAELETFR
jgi:broad specificity phosphatase PhoE